MQLITAPSFAKVATRSHSAHIIPSRISATRIIDAHTLSACGVDPLSAGCRDELQVSFIKGEALDLHRVVALHNQTRLQSRVGADAAKAVPGSICPVAAGLAGHRRHAHRGDPSDVLPHARTFMHHLLPSSAEHI